MSVPGSNILNQALRLIARQTISYIAYVSRATNSIGNWVTTYADPVNVLGSIQPVSRVLMQTLGLDMQKHYVNIFVPQNIVDIRRDVTSDQFVFAGAKYQALSITKWVTVDGWNQVLCVEVPNVG